jgi:hypothetical protein
VILTDCRYSGIFNISTNGNPLGKSLGGGLTVRLDIRSELCSLTDSQDVADRCNEYLSEDLDPDSRGDVLVFKAIALNNVGRPCEALPVFDECMTYEQSPVNMACLLTGKAMAQYSTAHMGGLMDTVEAATVAVCSLPESPLRETLCATLAILRGVHLSLAGDRYSLHIINESIGTFRTLGDDEKHDWATVCAAESALRLSDSASAKRFLDAAIGARFRIDALLTRAWILVNEGETGEALRLIDEARAHLGPLAPRHLAWIELISAFRHQLAGDDLASAQAITRARDLHKQDIMISYALNDACNAFRQTLSVRR